MYLTPKQQIMQNLSTRVSAVNSMTAIAGIEPEEGFKSLKELVENDRLVDIVFLNFTDASGQSFDAPLYKIRFRIGNRMKLRVV